MYRARKMFLVMLAVYEYGIRCKDKTQGWVEFECERKEWYAIFLNWKPESSEDKLREHDLFHSLVCFRKGTFQRTAHGLACYQKKVCIFPTLVIFDYKVLTKVCLPQHTHTQRAMNVFQYNITSVLYILKALKVSALWWRNKTPLLSKLKLHQSEIKNETSMAQTSRHEKYKWLMTYKDIFLYNDKSAPRSNFHLLHFTKSII